MKMKTLLILSCREKPKLFPVIFMKASLIVKNPPETQPAVLPCCVPRQTIQQTHIEIQNSDALTYLHTGSVSLAINTGPGVGATIFLHIVIAY